MHSSQIWSLRSAWGLKKNLNNLPSSKNISAGDYVKWTFPPGAIVPWNCLMMNFQIDSAAMIGHVIEWAASFGANVADACPGNDQLSRDVTILLGSAKTGGADNIQGMEVYHTGNIETGEIEHEDSVFSYVINFQNTTPDTVYQMTIEAHVSEHLNIESISYPFGSKPFNFCIPNSQTLIWEFEELVLPDTASDELNSYGFVQFNIRMKPDLPVGTVIENFATIKMNFDHEEITNTVSSVILEPDGISSIAKKPQIRIFPNPAKEFYIVELLGFTNDEVQIKMYDYLGQEVFRKQVQVSGKRHIETIPIGNISDGLYFVSVKGKSANSTTQVAVAGGE